MAWRLADVFIRGEIDNTVKGRVTGSIELSGLLEPVLLNLRSNCSADLAGWRFRMVRRDPVPAWATPMDLSGLNSDQVGEAGCITADQLVRHCDCPASELLARIRVEEPPPIEWRKARAAYQGPRPHDG